jgi:hypothetical protein
MVSKTLLLLALAHVCTAFPLRRPQMRLLSSVRAQGPELPYGPPPTTSDLLADAFSAARKESSSTSSTFGYGGEAEEALDADGSDDFELTDVSSEDKDRIVAALAEELRLGDILGLEEELNDLQRAREASSASIARRDALKKEIKTMKKEVKASEIKAAKAEEEAVELCAKKAALS